MAGKARLFGDEEALEQSLESSDPKTAKAFGRKVKDFDEEVWEENARQIVVEGNLEKFGQNEQLHKFVVGTGDAVLVEASSYDRIWGIGLKANDSRAKRPDTWRGQSWLGFALMEVREELSQ